MALSGPSTYPLDAGHSAPSLKIGEQHTPLFAVIRDKLRERILSGEFTPGDRLIEGRLSDDCRSSWACRACRCARPCGSSRPRAW